jgi:hypothetical protein
MDPLTTVHAQIVLIAALLLLEPLPLLNAHAQPTRMQPMGLMPPEDVPLVPMVVIRTVSQV